MVNNLKKLKTILEIKKFQELLKKSNIVLVYTTTCKKTDTMFLQKDFDIEFKRFKNSLIKNYLIDKYKILPKGFILIGSFIVVFSSDLDINLFDQLQKLNKKQFFFIGGHMFNTLFTSNIFNKLFLKTIKNNKIMLSENYLYQDLSTVHCKQILLFTQILNYHLYFITFNLSKKI